MNIGGSGISGREAIVTLSACVLLGALAGLAVGMVGVLLTSNLIGVLGTCVLIGLAVGRAFDRPSIHRSS